MSRFFAFFGLFAVTFVSCQAPAPVPVPAPDIVPIECTGPCAEEATENNQWLVTRFWSMLDTATITNQDFADEKEKGFAPMVTQNEGFQQYLGSPIIDDTTLTFFLNIFDTQEEAAQATIEAEEFVNENSLNQEVQEKEFLEGQFEFLYHNCEACPGCYLATRKWTVNDGSDAINEDITDEFLDGFAPTIIAQPGFVAYGGALMEDGSAFFYNIFETEEQAKEANALAAGFIDGGDLAGEITLSDTHEGFIDFDYVCTPTDTDMTEEFSTKEEENVEEMPRL